MASQNQLDGKLVAPAIAQEFLNAAMLKRRWPNMPDEHHSGKRQNCSASEVDSPESIANRISNDIRYDSN